MTGDFPTDRPASPAWLTVPASIIYGWLAAGYHRRFDRAEAYRAAVPVISVGNITVGGTGKTPTVIALAKLLRERFSFLCEPNAIAVLSRGYGRLSSEMVIVAADSDWRKTGDEPLLIKRSVPEVAVVVHADRRIAAEYATRDLNARLLLLDDGFQHRRLGRDLDLVLLDGEHPLGNGYLLPAGPLREPSRNLGRASAIVGVGPATGSAQALCKLIGRPFLAATPQVRLPSALSDGSMHLVLALSAIARPQRFVNSLLNKNLTVVAKEFFPDHHVFQPPELKRVADQAQKSGAEQVVTTEKDRIRIDQWEYPIPLVSAGLEMQFSDPDRLMDLLTPVVTKREK